MRAAGNGLRVLIIQFIKGRWKTSEDRSRSRSSRRTSSSSEMGMGFTIERLSDPRIPMEEHEEAAARAFERASEVILADEYDMVVLDEILGSIKAGLVTLDDVLGLIREKPPRLHLVLTGRGAPPELVDAADLVTEMKPVKHPLQQGIKAQRGGSSRPLMTSRARVSARRDAGGRPSLPVHGADRPGADEAALLLNAINPRLGGVLIRGEKGTAKSTAVGRWRACCRRSRSWSAATTAATRQPQRLVRRLPGPPRTDPLPTASRRVPIVNLPVGATEDRLTGTIDIEEAIAEGGGASSRAAGRRPSRHPLRRRGQPAERPPGRRAAGRRPRWAPTTSSARASRSRTRPS